MFVVLLQVYVFPCHISEKLVKWLQRYHYFSIFQDGAWPPSSTSANFNDRRVLEVPGASLCQISSKSLKQFRRYRDFSVLSGSRWPSWIFKLWKSQPLATSIGTKCIMMQTFVTIGRSNGYWDITIFFPFSKMAAGRHRGFSNFVHLNNW